MQFSFNTDALPPLVVDLDGTLIRTDTLYELFILAAVTSPLRTLQAASLLARGRNHFKARLCQIASLNAAKLPYHDQLLDLIREHKAAGGRVCLVTAADQTMADAVARHVGLFDEVEGSSPLNNLKGEEKGRFLASRFGRDFLYAGDNKSDLNIWRSCLGAILVGPAHRFRTQLERDGTNIVAEFPPTRTKAHTFVNMLRLHQWLKNTIIFAPLLLSHSLGNTQDILTALAAFFIFGLIASGTYIVNDLTDLEADRHHPKKQARALASGAISIVTGSAIAIVLISFGLTASFFLSTGFAVTTLSYLGLTLLYSFRLKKKAPVDVLVIGLLFTLRIVAGIVVIGSPMSPWLISFSMVFFTSLALSKRHSELRQAAQQGANEIVGRGYFPDDWPLTLAFGVSLAIGGLVIMLLYVRLEAAQSGLYSEPLWLLTAPMVVLVWVMRLWMLGQRGSLHEDPVFFAIRDRWSWIAGLVIGTSMLLAL
jgi:4-hydroxybenzoate polyprenyltransferase/phosphoserine phosphatase